MMTTGDAGDTELLKDMERIRKICRKTDLAIRWLVAKITSHKWRACVQHYLLPIFLLQFITLKA